MSLSNEQIVDAIATKSLMEVMELVKAIEEKFGVSAAAPVAVRSHLEGVDAVEPGAADVGAVGILVRQRAAVAARVPFLAVHHAGMAAHAGVQVDHKAEFLLGRGGKLGHARISFLLRPAASVAMRARSALNTSEASQNGAWPEPG